MFNKRFSDKRILFESSFYWTLTKRRALAGILTQIDWDFNKLENGIQDCLEKHMPSALRFLYKVRKIKNTGQWQDFWLTDRNKMDKQVQYVSKNIATIKDNLQNISK